MNNHLLLNRRSFLAMAASATALLAAQDRGAFGAEIPSQQKRRTMRKGVMFGTVSMKGSVLEKMRAVKEAGFHGIEPNSHMNQEEVLRARDETGLEIPSVCCATHWNQTLTDPDAGIREKGLDGLKQALRDAHRYGATSVLLVPAVVNKQVSYAQAYERSREQIRKALPLAEELKVKIAIENVWNQFLLSPLEAARYVDEFNSPWMAWHFDVGNIIAYGWPEHWIRVLNKRIVKLHIKEFSREKANKEGLWKGFEVDLLKGDDDWPAVMKALDEVGYTGWAIAEQGGANSPEGLKKLSSELDQILAS
jgi:L-ribulose-5-phosphate 3-epimerase